jgi:aryl-alcohol dehydrogenase-like predicted oxidoreductase
LGPANVYWNDQSEIVIGKTLEQHKVPREKVVLSIKCFGVVNEQNPSERTLYLTPKHVNQHGLSRKHIFDAVDESVKRLGTYIDVLQIHKIDEDIEPEEIMRALHDVVCPGKSGTSVGRPR